ncbi:MAG: DoxX family membrane protein [Dermatophilaceae bacterium]|nr:DoxX family membrane protein [Dermatophilaceae bacterium]NUR80878.1 DoxX family membrane protein [Dermatophilaceae bacterium]
MPERIVTGAYILHSGIEKWSGSEDQAQGVHGMAAAAYPFLGRVEPKMFLKAVSVAEIATGTALLLPFVPNRLAGAALTAFSGGLVGLYLRMPNLRRPGSVWPSPDGIAVSKDAWLLGIGTSLLADRSRR